MKTGFSRCSSVALGFFLSLLILIIQPSMVSALEPPVIKGSQQASTGGQQVLSVMNYQTGLIYTWSIESGGGSLSATTGQQVTYTAPDSNPNGENNPTIKLSVEDGGEVVSDTLSISVNAYTGAEVAYVIVDSELTKNCTPGSPRTECEEVIWFHNYDCSNNPLGDSWCSGCSCSYWGGDL